MNEVSEMTGIDWAALIEAAKTTGVEFGINVLIAIVIFYVGRTIARALQRGVKKMLQAQEVDKILQTFVSNLVYWGLMLVIIIAAIGKVGIQTTSLIAVMGAAGLAVGLALQGTLQIDKRGT